MCLQVPTKTTKQFYSLSLGEIPYRAGIKTEEVRAEVFWGHCCSNGHVTKDSDPFDFYKDLQVSIIAFPYFSYESISSISFWYMEVSKVMGVHPNHPFDVWIPMMEKT